MSSRAAATRLSSAVERPLALQLVAAVALTALLLFVLMSLWLAARRLSGAFTRPLSSLEIVASAVVIESLALGIRRILANTQYSLRSTQYSAAVTAAAMITLTSLILPGTPVFGTLLALFVFVGAETANWLPFLRQYLGRFSYLRSPAPVRSVVAAPTEEAEIPPGLVQLPAEDRLGIVHIAFVPPLPSRPQLTAHALDADDVDIRLTQVEIFGARLEVRVPQMQSQPRHILVEVLGSATAPRSA
jgi:hypothetical protein